MNIYWSLNSIPELAGLPKAQQRKLWRSCLPAALRIPRVWLAYLGMALGVGLIVGLAAFGGIQPIQPLGILINGTAGGLGGLLVNQVLIRALRPLLAARRAAMAPDPARADGSYHVPPAF